MPICASGEISLGGSTVGRSVNIEIGAGATDTITMDQANVRSLANVTTAGSQISMNCFYGRTAVPAGLGCVYCGGYYTGVIDIGGGVCYYLVVSPNATGCSFSQWKNTGTLTAGTSSCVNGYSNTWGPMNNADHPAGNFTATRSINGFSDWYLPAIDELITMNLNRGSMPVGERYNILSDFWSSTQHYTVGAYTLYLFGGFGAPGGRINCCDKTSLRNLRALRRSRI